MSLTIQLLYRKHVLDEDDVPGVPAQLPPYLSQDLFNIIKKVKNESPLSITSLTEKTGLDSRLKTVWPWNWTLTVEERNFAHVELSLASQSNNWLGSLLVTMQTTWYTTWPVLLPLEDVAGPALHPGASPQDGSLSLPSLQAVQARDRNSQAWASRMFFQWKHWSVTCSYHPEPTSLTDSRISSLPRAIWLGSWYGTPFNPACSSHSQLYMEWEKHQL